MTRGEELARELSREAKTTRRFLERLPDDRWGWRPHAKSYTLGELGCHLIDCVRWIPAILGADSLDLDPATFQPARAATAAALVATFDADAARARELLAAADDDELRRPWRLAVKGKQLFERAKGDTLRDMTFSHLIHHRGQLAVYLRLLDVPVPGAYGPTADEPF